MRRKRKSLTPDTPLAPVPSDILAQFVGHARSRRRSSTRRSVGSRRRSARALGGELTHHLDSPPGGEKPDHTTSRRI